MIKVKVVKDLYSKSNGFKPIDNLVGEICEVDEIRTYKLAYPAYLHGKKFVVINGLSIYEGEFEIVEGPVENSRSEETQSHDGIFDIQLMEVTDNSICGSFVLNRVIYGFCFTPTNRQKIWDFSPRLRIKQTEVKEALTARIFRDVMV